MKRFLKLFDYIFVLRPSLFFAVWTIFLAGFFVQNKFGVAVLNPAINDSRVHVAENDFLWISLLLTFLMGAVFILNQIMDRHTDSQNKKLFLISEGHITPRAAYIEASILVLVAVVFAFKYSLSMGILFVEIIILIGIIYNFKPFNWKDKPILGLVTNIFLAFLLFTAGWIIHGLYKQELLIHAIPYVSAVAAVYLYTTLPDVDGDASAQKLTFGVKYGFKATVYCGFLLLLITLISAYILKDELIFYPAFFSVPFYVWVLIKLRLEDVYRAIRFPILLLALTICIKYKIEFDSYGYFLILVGVYYISKLYYKLRFGIDYPKLSD